MPSEEINLELGRIALERVDGSAFEKFVNSFYPSIAGEQFVPLGGTADGGADAFQDSSIVVGKTTGHFYQASTEQDYPSKIKRTVKRLREVGRAPTTLTYVTSRLVKQIDIEEANLGKELSLTIRIRDGGFILSQLNSSVATRAAFNTYLRPYLDYLKSIGSSTIVPVSRHVSSPAIYVFLRQELDRRQGNESLVNSLADGLILWALEGTDPDKGIFFTSKQVVDKIEKAIPPAAKILRGVIPQRLRVLSKIPKGKGRPVRWHKKQNRFSLWYGIRKDIESENADDEALRLAVLSGFETRLVTCCQGALDPATRHELAQLALSVVQRTFEHEGLEFAAFLQGTKKETPFTTIADHVDACITESYHGPADSVQAKEAILETLRGAFYESTIEERLLFSRLSATYTLLFSLNTEPRLVEYFQNMAADFYLYVGSDLLVRTLSERYLREADQMTRNMLLVIKQAGGELVLAETILDEIHSHLIATDRAFRENYADLESSITLDIARHIDRILIRAYFYARLRSPIGVTPPESWAEFISQFCDYRTLYAQDGREQLKRYLIAQFQMKFKPTSRMLRLCDPAEVDELTQKLNQDKQDERLARCDALSALTVYGRREQQGEGSKVTEFGYRTWWLTGETLILKHTKQLEKGHGAGYLLRPAFVLSFISLSPSASEVHRAYREIFPSLLGIKLARRVNPEELKQVVEKAREAQKLEPARRMVVVSELSDKLKADFLKRYGGPAQDDFGEEYGP